MRVGGICTAQPCCVSRPYRNGRHLHKPASTNQTASTTSVPPLVGHSPTTSEEHHVLLEHLQRRVHHLGTQQGINVVAFSGGVDSSLTAWLVQSTFEDRTLAALGTSASVSEEQRHAAQLIAEYIGIELLTVPTDEGALEAYRVNDGQACYWCKSTLYSTLYGLGDRVVDMLAAGKDTHNSLGGVHDSTLTSEGVLQQPHNHVVLFNGTNADDALDPTRVGLVAAARYGVASPLYDLSKTTVRQLARYVGLPNHNWAASPCLRSRLQVGVRAEDALLQAVGVAEAMVRGMLGLDATHSVRVRVMNDGSTILEVEEGALAAAQEAWTELRAVLTTFDFVHDDMLQLRPFRSGSVAS